MILPVSAAYVVVIFASLFLAVLLAWLLGRSSKFMVVPGFALGVCAGIFTWTKYTVSIVDIKSSTDIPVRIAFFQKEFKTADGQSIPLTPMAGKEVFIVNETDTAYELERIYYGDAPAEWGPPIQSIYTHSYLLARNIPDYYPGEHPNQQILINTSTEGRTTVRNWLRKK